MRCKYNGFSNFLMLLGRILFALVFIFLGYEKLMGLNAAAALMVGRGIPFAGSMVFVVTFLELLGGILVLIGWYTRLGAFFILLAVLPTVYFLHTFWTFVNPSDISEHFVHFMKNVSILGGALYIIATGAGHYSIDGWCRKACGEKNN